LDATPRAATLTRTYAKGNIKIFLNWVWQTHFFLQMPEKLKSGETTNITTVQRQNTDAKSLQQLHM